MRPIAGMVIVAIVALACSGCGVSESVVATAMAQTEEAQGLQALVQSATAAAQSTKTPSPTVEPPQQTQTPAATEVVYACSCGGALDITVRPSRLRDWIRTTPIPAGTEVCVAGRFGAGICELGSSATCRLSVAGHYFETPRRICPGCPVSDAAVTNPTYSGAIRPGVWVTVRGSWTSAGEMSVTSLTTCPLATP